MVLLKLLKKCYIFHAVFLSCYTTDCPLDQSTGATSRINCQIFIHCKKFKIPTILDWKCDTKYSEIWNECTCYNEALPTAGNDWLTQIFDWAAYIWITQQTLHIQI